MLCARVKEAKRQSLAHVVDQPLEFLRGGRSLLNLGKARTHLLDLPGRHDNTAGVVPVRRWRKDVVGGEDDKCEGEEVDEGLFKQTTKHHELLSVANVSKPGFPTARLPGDVFRAAVRIWLRRVPDR